MIFTIFKRLICLLHGHNWKRVIIPNMYASLETDYMVCTRCDKHVNTEDF